MLTATQRTLVNGVSFQLVWLCCVVLQGGWAPLALLFFLLVHCCCVVVSWHEWKTVASVAVIGSIVDQGLLSSGVFTTDTVALPLWLICLWCAFPCTLHHAFSFFHGRPWLSALFGAVGGACSYVGAIRLGAAASDYSLLVLGVIFGVIWAVLFPLFIAMARWVNTSAPKPIEDGA